MPLKAPNLDDRSFEDIKALVRARIPRYTKEWTDFNESDPGITLIELFSWLTEMMLFQMNRVPERNYIKFLKLLNMELLPPAPAQAHLTFLPRAGAQVQTVPIRSRVAAQSQETGELVSFETDEGLDLIPYPLSAVQVFDGAAFQSRSEENASAASRYAPFGATPQVGSALYLGFTPPDTPPPPGQAWFPQQLRFRVYLPAETQAGTAQRCEPETSGLPPAPPANPVWEYRYPQPPYPWRRLSTFKDETAAFTREGYIVVEGPAQVTDTNEGRLTDPEEKHIWLRCRIDGGAYPAGQAPEIEFIRPNTVPARSVTTVRDEALGRSDGTPDQFFELRHKPILTGDDEDEDNLTLRVEAPGREPEPWKRVADFLASGPDDPHFVLKAAAGTIHFGNGQYGRIPAGEAEIIVSHYRYGGGESANVGPGTIVIPQTTLTGVDTVTNEREAVGGRDEQDIEDLKAKAPCVLRHRNRAVTAGDFAALAERAGGVVKATALTQSHPDFPDVDVPGAITVVILPDTRDSPPEPSGELIRHVCGYLDKFRLLTTELWVTGPRFIEIRVEVKVTARPQVAAGTVERLVREALDNRLDPLDWPFGRDFNPTGLYRDIYRVVDDFGNEVVKDIPHLAIVIDSQERREGADLSKAVTVKADELIYAGAHDIVVVPAQDL